MLDPPLSMGGPRERERLSDSVSDGRKERRRDTLLLVSAVCYPEDYDWQRDTAYGRVPCSVKLFSGKREVLSVPAGPGTGVGASIDGHHIIDGSLYTVYSDAGGTYIGRDGVRLAHWPEREYVCGLMYRSGTLYTLGLRFDGTLCLRADGRELLGAEGGIPFGGFGADTYGPGGALYEDDGAVCFAFKRRTPGGWSVNTVVDGEASEVLTVRYIRTVYDARRMHARNVVLYEDNAGTAIMAGGAKTVIPMRGAGWLAAGIVEWEGEPAALGRCRFYGTRENGWAVGNASQLTAIAEDSEYLYAWDSVFRTLSSGSYPDCRLFGRSCGALFGERFAVALTPKDGGQAPYVLCDGSRTEYDIHGFLSGVAFKITD